MTPKARLASSIAAVSRMSWLVAPRWTALDRGLRHLPGQRPGQPGDRVTGQGRESAKLVRVEILGPRRRGDRLA